VISVADKISKDARSKNMSAIRSKGTQLEDEFQENYGVEGFVLEKM